MFVLLYSIEILFHVLIFKSQFLTKINSKTSDVINVSNTLNDDTFEDGSVGNSVVLIIYTLIYVKKHTVIKTLLLVKL